MVGTTASEALGAQIRSEAAACGGVLPFVRFMELALYAPELGYYERGRAVVGRGGDFYTSASVGPVFGELLAFRFARWQAEDDGPAGGASQIIEAGAHDGRLARDILAWLRSWRPALAGRIRYTLCEPSPVRRAWQAETLAGFSGQVDWIRDIREARSDRSGVRGVVSLPAQPTPSAARRVRRASPRLGCRLRPLVRMGRGTGGPRLPMGARRLREERGA